MQSELGDNVDRKDQVRVSTVDNFQGEEAAVVLVSLVRSNDSNAIGFLREPQRINVLLSRAREGLVLFGNAACLRAGSGGAGGTWDTVLDMLPVCDGFAACCEQHGHEAVLRDPAAFAAQAPRGGCTRECGAVLACGHRCTHECHAAALPHSQCREGVETLCVPVPCAHAPLAASVLLSRLLVLTESLACRCAAELFPVCTRIEGNSWE